MPQLGARLLIWLVGCLLLLGAGWVCAEELQPIPALTAHVTDTTGTLSAEQRGQLEAKLAAFERGKGAQIALLIVPTVKPEAIEQYSLRVVEAWKLGRQGVDDGAMLIVAKQDRKLRIEVGYGLEGVLNDATAKRIVSETIAPRFKLGDFYGGVDAGLDAMIQVVGGEALPPNKASTSGARPSPGNNFDALLPIGFILIFVVGGVLRAIFGRFLGAGIIGALAGVIAWLLVSSLLIGGLAALIAFFTSLFGGLPGGSGYSSGGGPWGGSSGGFSGGGGGFGGGGASGDW